MTKDLDSNLCAFCDGKELAIMGIGQSYPIGQSCYEKSIKNGAEWDETMSLAQIKKAIKKRRSKAL